MIVVGVRVSMSQTPRRPARMTKKTILSSDLSAVVQQNARRLQLRVPRRLAEGARTEEREGNSTSRRSTSARRRGGALGNQVEQVRGVPGESTSTIAADEEPALEANARTIFGRGRAQLHDDLEAIEPSFKEGEEDLRPLEWQALDEWAQSILSQMDEDGPSPAAVGAPSSLVS